MENFQNLLESFGVPFNRSERHFTGTILSILFCQDEFREIWRIMNVMAPSHKLEPTYSGNEPNILFFTEYDLRRAQYVNGQSGADGVGGDTPDMVWFVRQEGVNYLFAIEAKMYDKPYAANLKRQLEGQHTILSVLAGRANVAPQHIFHFALVPGAYATKLPEWKNVITWEQILELYRPTGNRYCIDTIAYAIARYNELVGQSRGGSNSTGKYTGQRIVDDHELNIKYIGCGSGLKGLREHVENNTWRKFPFEVIQEDKNVSIIVMPKVNWFTINDFLFTTGNKAAGATI